MTAIRSAKVAIPATHGFEQSDCAKIIITSPQRPPMYELHYWPTIQGRGEYVRLEKEPRIAAYLRSDRRIAFNQQGIFRHYAELDDE